MSFLYPILQNEYKQPIGVQMATDKIDNHKHDLNCSNDDSFATKKDLKISSLEMRNELLNVKMELSNDIKNVKMELTDSINKVRLELTDTINKVKNDLDNKINSMTTRLGALTVTCFGILLGFLTYWHK